MRAGADLAGIDQALIEPAALDEDEKAALWLLAWCRKEGGKRCLKVMVTVDSSSDRTEGAVMLREWINVADFESEHFVAQLVTAGVGGQRRAHRRAGPAGQAATAPRTVTKPTAVSLHGDTYGFDAALARGSGPAAPDPYDLSWAPVCRQGSVVRNRSPARHRPPRRPQAPARAARESYGRSPDRVLAIGALTLARPARSR